MTLPHASRAFCQLVLKDLRQELRAGRVWPSMLLLGIVLALMLAIHVELPPLYRHRVLGGLLWMAVYFSGTLALERSFGSEREGGCWGALLLYPVSPGVIFLAKLAVNFAALTLLEVALIPAFILLTNAPLAERPGPLVLICLLGNVGCAALGVMIGALTAGISQRGGLLALLLLPLLAPVILGAAEATRLLVLEDGGAAGWRWLQLLGVFAVLFTTLGMLLFDVVVEE